DVDLAYCAGTCDATCEAPPPPGDPNFAFDIDVTGEGSTYTLTAGFSPDATDGYDDGIDSYAPPAPPPPAFDAALSWGGDRYYTQILNGSIDDLVEHVYDIALAYASDNLITLTWDNTGWSDLMSSCLVEDSFGGAMFNVDMLTDNSLTLDNPAFNLLKLKVTPTDYSPPADPSISITSPMDGATMSENDFSVSFEVENFIVEGNIEGHIHVYVDGSPNAYGEHMVYSTDPIALTGVPDGAHTIMLQLVDQAHQPFDPSIESVVNITVDTSVPNTAPEAGFTWTADGLTVTFSNSSFDPDGDEMTYSWDFGDGNSSTDENPIHTYDAAGTYGVSLNASDGDLSSTTTADVTVTDEDPGDMPEFAVTINTAGGTSNYPLTIGVSPDATD
ncbi:MAG: DUF6130 family protein, partial [Candidatus Marinimicrobia bacterium]|nr:DUF6130 family protein [Candidatus Neomarinimicrobiota bacterium]